jgi:hypothetical protein
MNRARRSLSPTHQEPDGTALLAAEVLRMEMTTLENLKRTHTHLKRIAREIVPEAVRT